MFKNVRISIFIGLLFFVVNNCDKDHKAITEDPVLPDKTEIVDIRIFEDGHILINGKNTNYSSLPSLIETMNISEKTLVRFIFVMGEQTPLVYETTRLLQQKGTSSIHKIILPKNEFYTYLGQNIHLDILENGRILVDGNELYVEDLEVALDTMVINPDKTIILTLPEYYSESTHSRSLEILDSLGFDRKYADLSVF